MLEMKYQNSYVLEMPNKRSIETIDDYITQYLNIAKKNREIKGLQNLSYEFEYSSKSDSCYLVISYNANDQVYSKQIRISDHRLKGYYGPEFVVNQDTPYWDKSIKKQLKSFVKKQIESFYTRTNIHIVKSILY